jgi:hypothetical protein
MVKKLKLKSNKELKSTFGIDKAEKVAKNTYKKAAPVLNEAFNDPDVNRAVKKTALKTGKVIKKEALPTAVSLGIPIAQMGATALGTYLTGNPMVGDMMGDFTGKMAKEYIPDKYQSKNKYVNMLSEGLEQIPGMMSGDVDPMEMMDLGGKFMGTVQGDIFKGKKKGAEQYSTPYDMEMEQMMNPYIPQYQNHYSEQSTGNQPAAIEQPGASNQPLSYTQKTDNIANVPTYAGDDDTYDDEIKIKTTPFQQKEGSSMALMGAGIKKKKRGRPKKTKTIIHKVEIIKKLPHEQFHGAQNASLNQLLQAQEMSRQRNLNQNLNDMTNYIKNDMKDLKDNMQRLEQERNFYKEALGAGIRPKKGSPEMAEKMARLRAMKRK